MVLLVFMGFVGFLLVWVGWLVAGSDGGNSVPEAGEGAVAACLVHLGNALVLFVDLCQQLIHQLNVFAGGHIVLVEEVLKDAALIVDGFQALSEQVGCWAEGLPINWQPSRVHVMLVQDLRVE